ncbi:MAG: nodulation protein NfeD [Nitrospiraceae bacterium]
MVSLARSFAACRPGFPGFLLFAFLVCTSFVLLPMSFGAESPVVVATYEGVINPVSAEYLHDALIYAEEQDAEVLVVRLDTPGGLDTSMRRTIKDFTNASLPVVVYVAPSGGRAASAGVFITMAAQVAAMAPGTNIGAAHPVAMGGGEMDKTMKEKVENDSAAYIKSIAEKRGRNAEWAEDAVRKSVSATEKEALELNIIDLIAEDLDALLEQLDGQEVELGRETVVLQTKGAPIREFPMGWRLEALKALSDPNIAYVLMTIGTIGLMAEMYNPGAILPGIVGAISLILAFYSFQSLPVNYAGVLLYILGVVFFVLEAFVTSYGLLAMGGVAAMILGSLMLIKTDAPFLQLSWWVIAPVILVACAFIGLVVRFGWQAIRGQPMTGHEGMVGMVGVVKTPLSPHGTVAVHGELWEAVSEQPAQVGESVQVTRLEGLKLYVKPTQPKGDV